MRSASTMAIICFVACLPAAEIEAAPAVEPVGLIPDGTPFFSFADGFEDARRLRDIFPADLSRWHQMTLEPNRSDRKDLLDGITEPPIGRNHIVLSSVHPWAGRMALECHALPYNGSSASKADVSRTQLSFRKGDIVVCSARYFIRSGSDLTDLFIWDLEAESPDPRYAGQPGRRLYFQSGEFLASDLGKWVPAPVKFRQKPGSELPFPKDRWVRIDLRLFLSEAADGAMDVWQDGAHVIAGRGQTLPEARSIYTSLEVGISANGNVRHAQTVLVDGIELRGWRTVQAAGP